MNCSLITQDDKEWLSYIEDLSEAATIRKTPKFTKFCDERTLLLFNEHAKKTSYAANIVWGGYPDSDRAVIGFFPDFLEPDSSLFPLSLIKVSGAFTCSHRDFLGSLLGLGISRDMIGDILISDSDAFIFLYNTVKDYVMFNLTKVSSHRVTIKEEENIHILPQKKFEEIQGTVSSVRLDCVVSLFTRKSRSDSQALISSERVFVNYSVSICASQHIKEGDIISVRGFGKMRLSLIGGETKKGRIKITISKYV
ncbi:MAG: RNA-binding protein [Ruminococcaceae bacterium]|nr:RNA-binding protein [Oscillospiraceae bacterium]